MADQKKQEANSYAKYRKKGKSVQDVTSQFYGVQDDSIQKTLAAQQLPQLEAEDLLDTEICILGYSERSGEQGPFAVIVLLPEAIDEPHVMVTGAHVLLKKMIAAEEKNAWPLVGKLIRPEGKRYFDLV